jgi:hypothetical protein
MKRVTGFKYISTNILANRTVQEEITEGLKCEEILSVWDKFWVYNNKNCLKYIHTVACRPVAMQ